MRACEVQIHASGELQWRQVHPNEVHDCEVTAGAFRGTPADRDAVSCCRSITRTPQEAFDHHIGSGFQSYGTFGVTADEIVAAQCNLIDDSACSDVTAPAHSYIAMHDLSKTAKKEARVLLAALANSRGIQYPP